MDVENETISGRKADEQMVMNSFSDAVIDSIAEGLCVCHAVEEYPYVRFTIWNRRMHEITGYDMAEINRLGWYQSLYPDPDIQEKARRRMDGMRKGLDLIGEEWLVTRRDGARRFLKISTSLLEARDGMIHVLAVIQDITEERQVQNELRQAEEKFRFLAENIQEVFWLREGNKITYVSPMYEKIWERSRKSLYENPASFFDSIHPEDRPRLAAALGHEPDGEGIEEEYRIVKADGSVRWIQACSFPVDGNFEAPRSAGIARDITDRKRTEDRRRHYTDELEVQVRERTEELQKLVRQLERKNRDLEDFAYAASHDLQEPLRKILTFSHAVIQQSGNALSQTAQEYLHRLQGVAGRMQDMIRSLLDYSRVTTSSDSLDKIDLNGIVDQALEILSESVEKQQAVIRVGQLPALWADPVQMVQLFQNLIGNALKFSNGPPEIEIYAESDGKFHKIFVADHGIGFDEKYMDVIFAPFKRLHSRQYEGSGIGLATCRRIVENHDGTIMATSKPDQGSTFIVTLPSEKPVE